MANIFKTSAQHFKKIVFIYLIRKVQQFEMQYPIIILFNIFDNPSGTRGPKSGQHFLGNGSVRTILSTK